MNWRSPNLVIAHCNIAHNTAGTANWWGVGLFIYFVDSDTDITNSILWHNYRPDGQLADVRDEYAYITYCNISQGVIPGAGNINANPLFDQWYHIPFESPCRDTGDPNSPLDPDSSRADMGVRYFHQD